MIPWGALPHSPRRMHSQLAFTSGGWLMRNDVKKAKSKLQKAIDLCSLALSS